MTDNPVLSKPAGPPRSAPRELPRQLLVRLQNMSHRMTAHAWARPVARLIEILIRIVWSAYLPAEARIDASVHLGHNGLGVVVNKDSEIGPNCFLGVHVVLGGKAPLPGAPRLERNVSVHAGAKLIGAIVIGEGSVIGANAVVTEDIPAYSLALGVPARIVKSGIDPSDYR